jgi:MFS family permease
MLGFGVLSRLLFGLISDRIGGLRTLIIASSMQLVALACFIPFDGLVSLYVVSIIFGLFQGGIVPAYAIIIREHFASSEVGLRVGAVMMATQLGMALGGWSSGAIYDVTGSYLAAFIHGVSWNSITLAIGIILYFRFKRRPS